MSEPDTELMPAGTNSVECSAEGCTKPVKSAGLCGTHYQRQRRTGSADTVRKPGPKPRNGRDPRARNLIALTVLGTASKRSESRWHRTNRITEYLEALAYEQFGCTAGMWGFSDLINRKVARKEEQFPNFAAELQYAELLLWAANENPEMWLEIVNEVCDHQRDRFSEVHPEPRCHGNHSYDNQKENQQ
jgi:hypothetical protein